MLPISVSESSLLRSPKASEGEGGALGEAEARKRGNTVGVRDQVMDLVASQGQKVSRAEVNLFPTPNTMDMLPARDPSKIDKSKGGYANVRETVINELMPTPMALDGEKGGLQNSEERRAQGLEPHLPNVARDLLPTTRTSMANGANSNEVAAGNPKSRLEAVTNWGKFEPAIRRWEDTIGRPAPAPTKPDGKEGAHRLSSAFTEWMMGLPEGWITEVGLSRNAELKACGNGVVPQQAELALRMLLQGVDLHADN